MTIAVWPVWFLAALASTISYYLFSPRSTSKSHQSHQTPSSTDYLPSALVPAYTTHARLLPIPAKHAFSYPLIYLGVDVDALEAGTLDLPGRLVKYGGQPITKMLGLRSNGYLLSGQQTFRQKIAELLSSHGLDKDEMARVWLVTMPSFLGFEGINPLSVWYVYNQKGALSCCILEVHNTFGEKHAYVLKTDSEYRHDPKSDHDFAWTFPRTFHVSPFNSRNGYYRLDLVDPFPAGITTSKQPRMKVSLRLLTPAQETKLTAVLASHPTHPAILLIPENSTAILTAVLRWPMALIASTPRILYHAYKLHYDKKLAVFPRPEPRKEGHDGVWNPAQNLADGLGTSVRDLPNGAVEKLARSIVLEWAAGHSIETGIQLEIKRYGMEESTIVSTGQATPTSTLTIITSCPKLYSHLLISPSAEHSLLLAPETLTSISDPALFTRFFEVSRYIQPSKLDRWIRFAQARYFLLFMSFSTIAPPPHLLSFPQTPFTMSDLSWIRKVGVLAVLHLAYFAEWLEEMLMSRMGAKWVPGGDPTKIWERALRRHARTVSGQEEAEKDEGWEEAGSMLY